jgi:ribosomal protein L12E/L44/L45/RPP1/RPP2
LAVHGARHALLFDPVRTVGPHLAEGTRRQFKEEEEKEEKEEEEEEEEEGGGKT